MAKIHIAFVGGETAPIMSVINFLNPEGVVLIHSEDTPQRAGSAPQAKEIAAQLPTKCKANCTLFPISPVDVTSIMDTMSKVRDLFADGANDISVNLTGGPKPWALAAFAKFSSCDNFTTYYIGQDNRLWKNMEEDCGTIDAWSPLKWENIQSFPFEEFTPEDEEVVAKIEKLRACDYSGFLYITNLEKNVIANEKSGFRKMFAKTGSWIEWNAEKGAFDAHFFHLSGKHPYDVKMELKSPNVWRLLFNFSWFEYKVALLISKNPEVQNIKLNNKISKKKNFERPDNEVDIIFDAYGRQYFVEVKTQVYNTTDVQKYNTVVGVEGGGGALKLFVTEAKMDPTAKAKCDDCHIKAFSLTDHKNAQADLAQTVENLSEQSNL